MVTNETRSDDDIANAVVYSAAVLNLNSKRIEALSYKLETAMLLTKDSRMKECVLDKALTAQLSEGSIKDFVKLKIVTCSILLDNAYRKGS